MATNSSGSLMGTIATGVDAFGVDNVFDVRRILLCRYRRNSSYVASSKTMSSYGTYASLQDGRILSSFVPVLAQLSLRTILKFLYRFVQSCLS